MKILFLEIETAQSWGLASAGPAFIGSYIRRHGHKAALLRVHPDQPLHDAVRDIAMASADLIGFSLTTRQWPRAAAVAREIRFQLDIPLIAGGLHPTFAPLAVLESGIFDYVCLGEGEEAVLDLLKLLEKGAHIPDACLANIWARGGKRPDIRPPLVIEGLPFMARDLLNETRGVVHISTMRGCPFPCTFCAGGAISRLYDQKGYIRRRSVNNVLAELLSLRENNPIHYVIFLDDTFTVDKTWIKAFCKVYGREMGMGFSINARAETVTPELIAMLKQAGCAHITYGVESGSRRVREDILKRPGSDKQYMEAFKWTKEAGMLATANYMVGIPGETRDDMARTLALNEALAPDDFGCFIFRPYPGTVLYDQCRERGFLPDRYLDLPVEEGKSVLNLPDLTQEDIEHDYRTFIRRREENYLRQFGSTLDSDGRNQALKTLRNLSDNT